MRSLPTLACVVLTLVLLVPGMHAQGTVTFPSAPVALSLEALFRVGGGLADTNGDQLADRVAASFLLAEAPTDDDVAAAADIAARLGFETMALDLPLRSTTDTGIVVAIGAGALTRMGRDASALSGTPLAAGEGLIAAMTHQGRPVVAVLGGDASGLRSAAQALAGHVPYLWDLKGATLSTVVSDIGAVLAREGLTPTRTAVVALRTRAGLEAIDRVIVQVDIAPADMGRALTRLSGLRVPPRRAGTGGRQRAAAQPDTTGSDAPALTYPGAAHVEIHVNGGVLPARRITLARVAERSAADQPPARRPGNGAKDTLDLSSLFTSDGLLGDSDSNLIPDRTDAVVSASGPGTAGVIDLAARIGLESTGVSLPLVVAPAALGKPDSQPTLVLVGQSHPVTQALSAVGKGDTATLDPGAGRIEVVRKAHGDKSAVVITGGDAPGVARAVQQVAERFPHLWQRGKDRTTLDDVENDVRRFVGGRSPAGQAAAALYKLDRLATQLRGRALRSARVRVHVEKAEAGLDAVVRSRMASALRLPSVDVQVENIDVQHASSISEDNFAVPSEVDEFWRVLRTDVIPVLKKKQPIVVEARLSESPELRAQLARTATDELVKAGASPTGTSVRILSAYKQGFSWLTEEIAPRLAGTPVDHITVRFAETAAPPAWQQQAMFTPTRWLLELFPVDAVLARDLKIDESRVTFEKTAAGSTPTYEVLATGTDGRQILRDTFEPRYMVRPYFDAFPDYEKVRVTTGWMTASQPGRMLVDRRIATDMERFWDRFQSVTLKRLYDYVMAMEKGKPRAENAPFFGELRAEVSLSEPEYALGVDKEHISPHESLHEDIYFGTLHFFDVLGRYARGPALNYPGRVIPVMRPKSDGTAGTARVTVTGFQSSRPQVAIAYVAEDGSSGELQLDVPAVAVDRPSAMAATVRAGEDGLTSLALHLKVDTDRDERESMVLRTREERVDGTMMSAEQVGATLANLQALRAAGLYRDGLSYHGLGTLQVVAHWTHEPTPETRRLFALAPNGQPAAFPDSRNLLTGSPASGPLVQWDTPIPPGEANQILARMDAGFPEATTYRLGQSYLGKDIWAMDVMSPIAATHWSQAKASTLKPTVVYSARQHANEVSSTSHTLKFAELLLTDPAWKDALKKVNFVFHPITNADGAQLAYDLYRITPDHMLHAGYLGALGVDVTNGQWEQDPVYPESKFRADLWRTWLPDIFLNPHGYPSHEWVMLFSEYAGWVRNRVTEARDWWGMRGWFTPGFGYVDDPKFPRHKDAAFDIRHRFSTALNAVPEIRSFNDRAYARYRKYGHAFDTENFKLDFTNNVLIYSALKGQRQSAQNADFMVRNPAVTIWTGSTEAPDETAYGDYMKLVATMGLTWDKALAQYLLEGTHTIERQETSFFGGVSLSVNRPRPPKRPEVAAAGAAAQGSPR